MSDVRDDLIEIGRGWRVSQQRIVRLAAVLDESGAWALDGARTAAHWVADALDVEVCTAREWVRIGRCLAELPATAALFEADQLSLTKVRALTRIATPANEGELCDLALATPASALSTALARWSARFEDDDTRERRHLRQRGYRSRTAPDGMVDVRLRLTPEMAANANAAIDAKVMQNAPRGHDATASRRSHEAWPSLAQQRADALVDLLTGGGASVTTEVILHVRGDGCTLDDGTPIGGTVAERLVDGAFLRAMIHDAESHPYDHVPDYDITKHILVEESALRCAGDHRDRHRKAAVRSRAVTRERE